ncbi:hypothetical protein [Sulfurimonas sp. CS5]|uniref:hypothetical protein n=1 Tax=Sulfurimonas sp. CS5 TaxID=3391145 RepID=UPI0039EB2CD9
MAKQKYNKQISAANTSNKVNKLTEQKGVHINYLWTVGGIEVGSEVIPFAIDKSKEITIDSIQDNYNVK